MRQGSRHVRLWEILEKHRMVVVASGQTKHFEEMPSCAYRDLMQLLAMSGGHSVGWPWPRQKE